MFTEEELAIMKLQEQTSITDVALEVEDKQCLEIQAKEMEDGAVVDAEFITDEQLLEASKKEIEVYKDFHIQGESGFITAGQLLAKCKDSIKEVKRRLALIVDPLKEKKKAIDVDIKEKGDPFRVTLEALDAMKDRMNTLVLGYHDKMEAQAKEKQRIADLEWEKKHAKAEAVAEKKGTAVVIPAQKIVQQPISLHKTVGVQIKKAQTWTVAGVVVDGKALPGANLTRTNEKLKDIPDQYWTLNLVALNATHRSQGAIVPGTIHTEKKSTVR